MDLTYAGYLLFVVPGFVFLWTYRHFTNAPRMGEFEYAAWSFLWGAVLFMVVGWTLMLQHSQGPVFNPNNFGEFLGALLGTDLGISIVGAFPLGFLGAIISRWGLFEWIDKMLFKVLTFFTR